MNTNPIVLACAIEILLSRMRTLRGGDGGGCAGRVGTRGRGGTPTRKLGSSAASRNVQSRRCRRRRARLPQAAQPPLRKGIGPADVLANVGGQGIEDAL